MLKYVNAIWFNPWNIDTLGIVKCLDDKTKETRFFIGAGKGKNIQEDVNFILKYGEEINPQFMKNFLCDVRL